MKKNKFLIGTSGWSYPDWRGVFYPKDLPAKNWLAYYQTIFPIVEINATFYRFFPKEVFIKWRNQAHNRFHYIIKVPRIITHYKRLKKCKTLIKSFCRSVNTLENKLALILLQLPPSFAIDLQRLETAILSFDDPKKLVVEFRHKSWLTDETKALLQKLGCAFCAADSPDMAIVGWVTSPVAYIRLHGRKVWFNYKYNKRELKQIAEIAKQIYILFNNDYYSYACQNALTLKTLLNVKK